LSSGPTIILDYNPTTPNKLVDLALDLTNSHIYFTQGNAETGNPRKIMRVNMDGTNETEIVNTSLEEPFGIDLDLANSKVYFTTNEPSTGNDARLYRVDYGSNTPELLFSLSTVSPAQYIRDVKIDPVNDIVYWSVGGIDVAPGTIYFNDLNEPAPFASPSSFTFPGEPRGIDLDLLNNKIYWVCRGANDGNTPPMIMRANLDGSTIENIFIVTMFPVGFPPGPPGSAFIALDLRSAATVCITPPTADAGVDQTICETDAATLSGVIGGAATSITWTSTGDGGFNDDTNANTFYTPGSNDISNGSVTLTVSTNDPDGPGPCIAASDNIIITFLLIPTANAGLDQTICEGDIVLLSGSIGGSASSMTWTTMGDGSFDDPTSLTATYTPGPLEILNSGINLAITTDDPDGLGS
jgi:hypothetical protein